MSASAFLAMAIACVPALYAWYTGRQLLRLLDDPVFPERLHARQQRVGRVMLGSMVVMPFVGTSYLIWATPLLFGALLVAAFPFRRAVLGETWRLGAYLRYCVFDFVAGVGVALLAGFSPILVLTIVDGWTPAGSAQRLPLALVLGAAFAAVLLLWQHRYPSVWLRLHRASPIDGTPRGAEFRARFDAIMDRAGTALDRRPTIHRYGAPGGHIVNAVALPSLTMPAVALSDTLLERLELDESTAVFAHEIAHHEHYNTKRMRSMRWRAYLMALLVAILPAVLTMSPVDGIAGMLAWLYPFIVLLALGRRLAKNQAHETESDLRAVALTGDPGAVARALTKIHLYSRTPRRWAQDFERAASHPSLARRIQAIHAQGAQVVASFGAPRVLRSATAGSYVALDATRAYWFEGVPEGTPLDLPALRNGASSYRAVAYADLSELRIAAGDTQRALRATDRSGHSWAMPLNDADVAAVQSALDVVDVRLGTVQSTATRALATSAQWAAGLMLFAMMMTGGIGLLLIPALITLLAPTSASVAAMAAMALGRALMMLASGDASPELPFQLVAICAVAACGAWAVTIAWKWLRGPTAPVVTSRWRSSAFTVMTLALTGVVLAAVSAPAIIGDPAMLLGDSAGASFAVVMLGLGAALFALRQRRWQVTGSALVAVALLGGALAATGDRLFARGSAELSWRTGELAVVTHAVLGGNATQLQLSPGGTRYLARRMGTYDDDGERSSRFIVGAISRAGSQRTVEALQGLLVDEERLLLLANRGPDSLELRLERADASDSTVLWRVALPALADQRLTIDRVRGLWTLSGRLAMDDGALMTASGLVGDGTFKSITLPTDSLRGTTLFSFANGATLFTSFSFPGAEARARAPMALLPMLAAWGTNGMRWQLWRVDTSGRKPVASLKGFLACANDEIDLTTLCADQSRQGIQLWRVTAAGQMSQVSRLSRSFDRVSLGAGGKLAVSSYSAKSVALVDASTRVATRVRLPLAAGEFPTEVLWAPGGAVALVASRGGSRIVQFRLVP